MGSMNRHLVQVPGKEVRVKCIIVVLVIKYKYN